MVSTGSNPHGDALFAGDGEMAALMRAKDWSLTSLGPSDRWPQSLRTAVRILLTSRYQMWLGWGADLNFLLRGLSGMEQLRLVAVTGYGQEGDRERSRAAGFDSHLVKPIDLDALDHALSADAGT